MIASGLARVSAILPAFAESESLVELAARLRQLLGPDLAEILIVVSPGSPPETLAAGEEVKALFTNTRVLVQTRTPGVGFAYRDGIAAARGDLLLLMDSDGEFDPETAPRLLAKLRETGGDLVIGSRWMQGGGVEGYPPLKYFLNRAYQILFRLLYRTRIHDLTFGYKLGRASVLKALPLAAQFQEIGCEVTLRALRGGFRVEEVPTVWRARRQGTTTNPLSRNLKYAALAWSILTERAR